MRILPCGEQAVLLEFSDLESALAAAERLRAARSLGLLPADHEIVPAARTVLVSHPGGQGSVGELAVRLREVVANASGGEHPSSTTLVTIPVVYDGPDLWEVSHLTGLSPAEIVQRHTQRPWSVAFIGFAPGFAYCTGGDADLRVPRRATPRTSVPVGSVALADEFTGVYPRTSPGGWQLIGRTTEVLWDLDRTPPALLTPGTRVQFVAVG